MIANSKSGWWIVNLVYEAKIDIPDYENQIQELRIAVTARCEHWREAFWKARSLAIELEKARKEIYWVGIHSLSPIDSASKDLAIVSEIKLFTFRTASEIFDSCISEYELAEAVEEQRYKKDLNPDVLDSDNAGF
jgi:hypothetical protein